MDRELRVQDKILHPLGLQQIIIGDLRERIHPVTGEKVQVGTTGKVYYDIKDPRGKCRFLLAFESGDRVVHSNDANE